MTVSVVVPHKLAKKEEMERDFEKERTRKTVGSNFNE
jgi:hypothetical protein